MKRYNIRAMNTEIELLLDVEDGYGATEAEMLAADWFRQIENRFSRFRPDSELSCLNRRIGQVCMISDKMTEVLAAAESYRHLTDGIFNPFIKSALENAGYALSFDELKKSTELESPTTVQPVSTLPLILDPMMNAVRLPAQLDLGGLVKSWSVERLASTIREKWNLEQGLINAGGDLIAWGEREEKREPWMIGIEDPWSPDEDIGVLALRNGATATSGTLGRTWISAMGVKHHLIDPRTAEPCRSDVIQCTVSGPDLCDCEVWAKTLCILGLNEGLTMLRRKTRFLEALIFTTDRQIHYYGPERSVGTTWLDLPINHKHWI